MIMLFFSFLEMNIHRKLFQLNHGYLLLANIVLGFFYYQVVKFVSPSLAGIAFLIGMLPTAAVAPVITGYLNGRVDFVTISVLVTNCIMAMVIPFALPWLGIVTGNISTNELLLPILSLLFVPLAAAMIIRKFQPKWKPWLIDRKIISYYLFLGNVYVAISKATHFILNTPGIEIPLILSIGVICMVICLANFLIGRIFLLNTSSVTGSMALGRKNTMFGIWIGLEFMGPLAALGPMFYIIWQNIYTSFLLYQQNREKVNNS